MQLPEQTYRWIVSLNIIPNEGQLTDKNMVNITHPHTALFESGYNVAIIVQSILLRSGNHKPQCLINIKKDTTKPVKLTNWNFVWLSFDQLRMVFDPRIKDLIIQGQNSLIVEILKQLCDRDENKDDEKMRKIMIHQKGTKLGEKSLRSVRSNGKSSSLDLRKLNTQKDPDQAQSSLQFLILLLTSSLDLPVQEILGLFTNQNKYLAHVIVKGMREQYIGVRLFYNLLIKHAKKLKDFIQNDLKDAQSCLFAIKAGFISKDPQVAHLTISLFLKLGKIYHWLVDEHSKGASTILLGIKRHPHLKQKIWELLENIIGDNDLNFFTSHFKLSFNNQRQMIQVCHLLLRPISFSFSKDKLQQIGVFTQWLELTNGLFEGSVEDKIISFSFIGQMMLYLPEVITENESFLIIFRKGWKKYDFLDYVLLVDEVFSILDNLATNKSKFSSKILHVIIDIFRQISSIDLKKEYLVENFNPIIPQYPKIPTQYFIQAYKGNCIDAIDYELITTAIQYNEDMEGLAKIGQVILRMFIDDAVTNGYLGPSIYNIAKCFYHDEIGQAFIAKAVKDLLHLYSQIQSHKKNPHIVKPQPNYFNHKGNTSKVIEEDAMDFAIKQKQASNVIELVQKLCDLQKTAELQNLLKTQILQTNSIIRKNNFKVQNKNINALLRKFGVSKEEESEHDQQLRKRREANIEDSIARKKTGQMMMSRVSTGPAHLRRQFTQIVEKRKREEEEKKAEQEKAEKQKANKQLLMKKEIEKQKLLRGFGHGEAQLKEQGFWQKLIKEDKQIDIYPEKLMEQKDIEIMEITLKKYHRIVRHLFMKYTSSMHSVKSINNFQEKQQRKQTITLVQIIKFLKDYKLYFLTSNHQIQNLIRDINVRILNKRQTTQQLDFYGFEQFLIQFAAVIFTKPHTINAKINGVASTISRSYIHVSHSQLLQQVFRFLKMVFQERGQKTILFDEPEAAYFNESQVIKEFNKKIQEDPSFILPQGFKKIVEKTIIMKPQLSETNQLNITNTYIDVLSVLDQIIFQSTLNFHIIEPSYEKATKIRVKPHAFSNIRPKLMSQHTLGNQSRAKALSSVVQKKGNAIPPMKMLQRKVLSFGMRLGLSYVNYKDKLLGQQVAYVIDDMLNAIEQGKTTIEKQKIVNEAMKKRKEKEQLQKLKKIEQEKKRKQRKDELTKFKKQTQDKKKQELQNTKQERQKKRLAAIQKQKKKKQEMQKYLAEQKAKLKEKKQKEEEQKKKQKQEKKKKKEQSHKAKQKFEEYNQKNIEKLKKQFEQTTEKKRKSLAKVEAQKKHKQDMIKKVKEKINSQDHKKFAEAQHKQNQEIKQLFESQEIQEMFNTYDVNLKAIFSFLVKNTYLPLSGRKHNNQVILDTWNFFGVAFEINPCIIESKQLLNIFKAITKDKQVRKQYYLGLNFEQFQQALLRVAIKHKSIFNKIAERIREKDEKDGEEIQKVEREQNENEFDEEKEINVKSLLVEDDVNKDLYDDYGDISKVTPITLKGLIYYLKVPKDRLGQEYRFREITVNKKQIYSQRHDMLRDKLKEEYTLKSPVQKKKRDSKKVIKTNESLVQEAQKKQGQGQGEGETQN